ncbi:MAG: heme exporter protein CcmB [Pseudomonadota bacterium]
MIAVIRRDVRLALRLGGGGSIGVAFFVLVIVLIPLGIGAEPGMLSRVAGGLIWISALLAVLLTLDRLFQADFEDGSLDQLMLAPLPLEQVVLAKTFAHWLTTGLPITLVSPVLGSMLALPTEVLPTLVGSLAIGTPALSLIGAVGGAITVGVRRGGLLLSILVLPLYVPTLIFGARAVDAAAVSMDAAPALALTGVITLIAAAITPFAAAGALRINAA